MPRKIIIDTDPGVDDTMAIFFALRSPELDVIGLTTVFGNVHTDLATFNALRLLEIAGRTDIPVARGSDNPLTRPFKGPVPSVHGDDGQGNVHLPPPHTRRVSGSAAKFIIDQVRKAPGEITLVPIGPLTNLALALRMDPNIMQNVQEVVLMGGNAMCFGNATPTAEANILNDPEAADVVFSAHWPVTMVGLDVTHMINMTPDHLDHYAQADHPMAQHIARIVPHYRRYFENAYGIQGIYVHDSAAIAYLIDPTLFQVEQWPICVETQGISRGKTWPSNEENPIPPWEGRRPANVCVNVDAKRLLELELSRVTA
jgi:inosine-uridine nucleoside N-ribohydrolase